MSDAVIPDLAGLPRTPVRPVEKGDYAAMISSLAGARISSVEKWDYSWMFLFAEWRERHNRGVLAFDRR